MMGRAMLSLLAALAVGGCTSAWWRTPSASGESRAARSALTDADDAAMNGKIRDATARYELIVKQYPKDPIAAEALHRMAMLRLEVGSPIRDRRQAAVILRRLQSDYPTTLWGREARAWRGLLGEIDRCTAEATKRGADAEKLQKTLDSIRDSDLELETHP
jgi:hypothetical protein